MSLIYLVPQLVIVSHRSLDLLSVIKLFTIDSGIGLEVYDCLNIFGSAHQLMTRLVSL